MHSCKVEDATTYSSSIPQNIVSFLGFLVPQNETKSTFSHQQLIISDDKKVHK